MWILAFHRPLQGTLRVRIDRKDTRVKGPLGNTCHQIVMGNGRVESCFAHDSLSGVVGMPGLRRAQGGVCSEMPHSRLSILTAGQPWGGRSIEQVCGACQSSRASAWKMLR